jgi:hypothetical protein
VHGRRLEFAPLDVTCRCLDAHAVPKPLAQVQLDSIGGEISQLQALKRRFQVFRGSQVGVVSLGSAYGGLE